MNYIVRRKPKQRGRGAMFVSRRELAQHLFPSENPDVAVATLYRWIKGDPALRAALDKCGYKPGTRWLNRRIVEQMKRYIGF